MHQGNLSAKFYLESTFGMEIQQNTKILVSEILIVYCNVHAFKEWPTNFKLLFQALHYMTVCVNSQI